MFPSVLFVRFSARQSAIGKRRVLGVGLHLVHINWSIGLMTEHLGHDD